MKIEHIYELVAKEGFTALTLQTIDNYIKEIQDGTEDFPRFNLSEHAGFCTAGAPLIGASIIASYATASITASCNAEGGQGQCKSRAEVSSLNLCRDVACAHSTEQGGPANWQIDECQGFRDNWNGQGVNYISDHLALEDMHPANVFIDALTRKPICIDCIVKFVK